MQFDADTKAASRGAHLVAFDPRPEPEIEDHAQAKAQDLLGELPEFMLHLLLGRCVPRVGAEGPEPLIFRETHGAPVRGQLPREVVFPAPGNPQVRINRGSLMCQIELRVEPMPLTFRHDIDGAVDHADSGLVVDRVRGTVETGSPSLGAGQRVVG